MPHYVPFGYPPSKFQHRTKSTPGVLPYSHTILQDVPYDCDLLHLRGRILSLLRDNRIASLPVGFPFHCVSSGTSAAISHSSYQFKEKIYLSNNHSGRWNTHEPSVQEATFIYTSSDQSENGNMSWRIYLSAQGSGVREWDAPNRVCLAHVECPKAIFETWFGIDLSTDPQVVLKALATSIEQGVSVSFHILHKNSKKPFYRSPTWKIAQHEEGEMVLMATNSEGAPIGVLDVEYF